MNPKNTFWQARRFAITAVFLAIGLLARLQADQPQWGDARTHNLVSDETGLPDHFDTSGSGNLRWSIEMGNSSYATPVVVNGKVYIVSNRAEVLCLDLSGLADGNDGPFVDESNFMRSRSDAPVKLDPHDADILWHFSMTDQLQVHPHDAAHSIILVHGDHLYLNTANGVDTKHSHIPQPNAPSLIVLDRHTGDLLATDGLGIGEDIFHCNWSSPVVAQIDGRDRIIFCGGNGICYGFDPLPIDAKPRTGQTLQKVWQFDLDPGSPKEDVHDFVGNRHESPTNVMSQPVVVDDCLFVSSGGDIWWGKNEASLQCIKLSGTGDVTDKNLVWRFPLGRHCSASPTIHDGLVYIGDFGRTFYCLDRDSGESVWEHSTKAEFWSTALVADGKVYVGNKRGTMFVFQSGREKNLISETQFETGLYGSPVAAAGTLYLSTFDRFFALGR